MIASEAIPIVVSERVPRRRVLRLVAISREVVLLVQVVVVEVEVVVVDPINRCGMKRFRPKSCSVGSLVEEWVDHLVLLVRSYSSFTAHPSLTSYSPRVRTIADTNDNIRWRHVRHRPTIRLQPQRRARFPGPSIRGKHPSTSSQGSHP